MKKLGKTLMAIFASALMVFFFAVPVLKLKEIDMGIVILIGLVLMVANFVEDVREKDD
jgi:di/tricarboxylate transporter